MIEIMIADDHAIVREGLKQIISAQQSATWEKVLGFYSRVLEWIPEG